MDFLTGQNIIENYEIAFNVRNLLNANEIKKKINSPNKLDTYELYNYPNNNLIFTLKLYNKSLTRNYLKSIFNSSNEDNIISLICICDTTDIGKKREFDKYNYITHTYNLFYNSLYNSNITDYLVFIDSLWIQDNSTDTCDIYIEILQKHTKDTENNINNNIYNTTKPVFGSILPQLEIISKPSAIKSTTQEIIDYTIGQDALVYFGLYCDIYAPNEAIKIIAQTIDNFNANIGDYTIYINDSFQINDQTMKNYITDTDIKIIDNINYHFKITIFFKNKCDNAIIKNINDILINNYQLEPNNIITTLNNTANDKLVKILNITTLNGFFCDYIPIDASTGPLFIYKIENNTNLQKIYNYKFTDKILFNIIDKDINKENIIQFTDIDHFKFTTTHEVFMYSNNIYDISLIHFNNVFSAPVYHILSEDKKINLFGSEYNYYELIKLNNNNNENIYEYIYSLNNELNINKNDVIKLFVKNNVKIISYNDNIPLLNLCIKKYLEQSNPLKLKFITQPNDLNKLNSEEMQLLEELYLEKLKDNYIAFDGFSIGFLKYIILNNELSVLDELIKSGNYNFKDKLSMYNIQIKNYKDGDSIPLLADIINPPQQPSTINSTTRTINETRIISVLPTDKSAIQNKVIEEVINPITNSTILSDNLVQNIKSWNPTPQTTTVPTSTLITPNITTPPTSYQIDATKLTPAQLTALIGPPRQIHRTVYKTHYNTHINYITEIGENKYVARNKKLCPKSECKESVFIKQTTDHIIKTIPREPITNIVPHIQICVNRR